MACLAPSARRTTPRNSMSAQFAATLNGWRQTDRHRPRCLRRLESFSTVVSDAMMADGPSLRLLSGQALAFIARGCASNLIHFRPSLSLFIRPYFPLQNSRVNAIFLSNLVERE